MKVKNNKCISQESRVVLISDIATSEGLATLRISVNRAEHEIHHLKQMAVNLQNMREVSY